MHPSTLNSLFLKKCLKVLYSSSKHTGYRLSEFGHSLASDILAAEGAEPQAPIVLEPASTLPEDLFDTIVGHDEIKDLCIKALTSDKPTHLLFTGMPSSAKTMFLMELSRLGAVYILGSQATKAGISDVLFELRPNILLIDEIDRIGTKDISILLSLAETGIVIETKHGKQRQAKLETKIFAASNTVNMAKELLSRFMILHFKPYTEEEFLAVTTNVLVKRERVESELAQYIAHRVWARYEHKFPDPRQAVRIARLAKSREDVDAILDTLGKYSTILY